MSDCTPQDRLLDCADDGDVIGEGCLRARPGGKRYLVKMSLSLNENETRKHTLVSALSLDPKGMLIESQQTLTIGKDAYWSFMGISELRGITIPGTVLQEEPRPEWAARNRYYHVRFDEGAYPELQCLEAFIGEAPPKEQ